ncbi:glycosyltransferase family 2 protein [Thiocapsa marina]|uniref:Glycosyl transferase family 2 n=1 Tax=Thiocapsa marina 5811 TaxID=768671 RepID=F9U969_9GAMM|nr:glycosyltransferase family 2 protein [Thiocapsa marina]EGV19327.1 glycosyl transferase family 2 [Thiocapsa marina 5811]
MILIPAHNEAATIERIVTAARDRGDRPVVVMDDNSSDDTADLARAAGAIVLPLALQLGAWGATQTGLRFAARHGWPIAVTLDADGQHEPALIPELIAPIRAGEADVVIGACPSRASLARRIAWRYFRALTGMDVDDITSGFRAYNRAAIERLSCPDASLLDYQDVGVLLILRRQGLRIQEVQVPMQIRGDGRSRIFDSWWTVGRYMIQTSLLCIARIGRGPVQPFLDEPGSPV